MNGLVYRAQRHLMFREKKGIRMLWYVRLGPTDWNLYNTLQLYIKRWLHVCAIVQGLELTQTGPWLNSNWFFII